MSSQHPHQNPLDSEHHRFDEEEHPELIRRLAFYESDEFDSSPSASSDGVLPIAMAWLAAAAAGAALTLAIWL